jgi:hypothetical protein
MVAVGRVLLWTVALVAPGGFLLVPVLAASALSSNAAGQTGWRERLARLASQANERVARLQRYWTKS